MRRSTPSGSPISLHTSLPGLQDRVTLPRLLAGLILIAVALVATAGPALERKADIAAFLTALEHVEQSKVEGAGDNWTCKYPDTQKQVTFTLLFRSTADAMKQVAVFMSDSARKVGINLETELMTFPEFLRRQDEGTGQAYDAGWVMDYPDAQNILQLLYGPNKPPGINSASYNSKRYNSLYEELAPLDDSKESDLKRKIEIIRQMHEQLEEDTPWVLLEFRVIFKLYHDWHIPPKPNAFAYTYLKFEYSDSAERAKRAEEWEDRNYFWAFLMSLVLLGPASLMGWRIMKESKGR